MKEALPFLEDSAPVTQLQRTADGYLTGRVRAARTGTQLYLKSELGLGDSGTITVYRPPEAVFDEASFKTYAGKPITMGHPKGGVAAATWKDHAVGQVGSRVLRDGETVVVDFAVMDAAAVTAIEAGTREVSMGYSTPIQLQDGFAPDGTPYQAIMTGPIRINHMAVVDVARGGHDLRIGDGAPVWGATPVHKETQMSTKVVVLGDSAVTVALTDAAAIESFKASMIKQISDAQAETKKVEEEKDEEIGKLKAAKKVLEDAAITPAKLSKMIADRVALETSVKALDSAIVCDGVSDAELRKAAVVAKLGDAAVEGASEAEINGMFKAVRHAADSAPDDTVRDALRSRPIGDQAAGLWNQNIADAAGVKFKKGA